MKRQNSKKEIKMLIVKKQAEKNDHREPSMTILGKSPKSENKK